MTAAALMAVIWVCSVLPLLGLMLLMFRAMCRASDEALRLRIELLKRDNREGAPRE